MYRFLFSESTPFFSVFQFGAHMSGEFIWELGHIAFLLAHSPMSAVCQNINLALSSVVSSCSKSTVATPLTTRFFADPVWVSWRLSPLRAACIPRLKLLVESWAKLLEISKDGTKKVLYTDSDLSFLGMCSWGVLLTGVLLVAGSVRDEPDGGGEVCFCKERRNTDSSKLCCFENAEFLNFWRCHVSVLKRTLSVMGMKWKCANIFFQILSWIEAQGEEDLSKIDDV